TFPRSFELFEICRTFGTLQNNPFQVIIMRGGDLNSTDFSRRRMPCRDYHASVYLRRLGGQASHKEQIGIWMPAFNKDRKNLSHPPGESQPGNLSLDFQQDCAPVFSGLFARP